MYRSDGYRVKGNDPMYEIVPHIMPQRVRRFQLD